MKAKDIKEKSEKELKTMLVDKRLALQNFRFAVAGSKNRNVKEGKALRKDIARILTVMNKK